MEKVKKRWLIPLGLMLATALLGVLFSQPPTKVSQGGAIEYGDVAWMLTASGLVLLMTPGLAFFYGGMVSNRNIVSTMLQSFIALGVVSIVWAVLGFSLAFGDSIGGVIGNPFTFFMLNGVGGATHPTLSPTIPLALFALFQMKFAIITPALITGAFAERVKFTSFLLFIVLFTIFIYTPLAHMTWHPEGLLRTWGVLDFAGGTVVHISAGFAALAGAIVLGKRQSYGAEQAPGNIPFVLLGTGMLWFGWFGFNAGSALAANELAVNAFMNTQMASAAAMLTWIFFDGIRGKKPSAMGACIGAVVGLVAITPAAGFVSVGHSLVIGVVSSLASNYAVHFKSVHTSLDDTLDVFPCHGLGGIIGMILTGVFASNAVNESIPNGLILGEFDLFFKHLVALVAVSVFTFGASFLLYKLVDFFTPLRVNEDFENQGLDLSQHDEVAMTWPAELSINESEVKEAEWKSAGIWSH